MNKDIIFNNLIWKFAERFSAQAISFVVSVILGRIIDPSEYGKIAIVTVFIAILNVFVDSGLGNALIQKQDADDLDFSTVFYTNFLFSVCIYVFVFFSAPFISSYYSIPELTLVIRVLSLSLIASAIKNVQYAFVSRNLIFRKFFYSTLIGTIISGIAGITMAINNYGIWALVAQQLTNIIVDTLILWITVNWKPKKIFSFARLKSLFSFGWKLLVSALLETGYNELRQLLIAKVYNPSDLAYYNKGESFPKLIITNVNASIDSVLFPSMSQAKNDIAKIRRMVQLSIKTALYILGPILFGLAAISKNLVLFLLTEKWVFCVPYLRIFCFIYLFYPIHTANLNALKAMGRSDLFLRLETIKKAVGLIIMLTTLKISVWAMCLGSLLSAFLSSIINSWPNKKLLNYNYLEQIKDIFPNIAISAFMAVIVYAIGSLDINVFLLLILQIAAGIMIYVVASILLKNDSFYMLLNLIKDKFSKS